ncbi:RNA polymerase sigma factor [Halovulum sp. GXIMD14793]
MKTSDENLVRAAQGGDAAAFAALITRHYDLVYRLGFRVLGNQAEAEDLAQDICAALPGKLDSFRAEAKFTTWLHRIVLNAARDLIRHRATRAKAADGWGDVELMRRAEATQTRAELDWLTEAMQGLSDDLRETVALVLGEEMTHAAAAESLGVSEGTISWRMSEVKKALRAQAQEEEMFG